MITQMIKQIAKNNSKCQLVVAATGSGKTQMLVDVVAYRFEHELAKDDKRKLIIFTFTNSAADELSVRLGGLLQKHGALYTHDRIFIGTIHSWCRQYLDEKKAIGDYKVMEEQEEFQMINRIYNMLGLDQLYGQGSRFSKINKFINDLDVFYNEGLCIDDPNIPTEISVVLEKYFKFMEKEGMLDFGMLIRKASLVLDSSKGEPLEVYVDEYQDVNTAQVKLLNNMIQKPNSRLFAVGDPRQAIYQWRGSDLERMIEFEKEFPHAKTYHLSVNRRSRAGIIKFANNVADNMNITVTGKLYHMEIDPRRNDGLISVVNDPTRFKVSNVIELLQGLKDEGCDYEDISILFRSVKNHAGELIDALKDHGIPYYSPNVNKGTMFVSKFMCSVIELMKIMDRFSDVQNQEEENEMLEKIDMYLGNIMSYCNNKNKKEIHTAIGKWKKQLIGRDNNDYNFRKQLFDFCEAVRFVIDPKETELQEGFATVTRIMKTAEEVYRRRLRSFKDRPSPLYVLLNTIDWNLRYKLDEWANKGMPVKKQYGVTVATVHAAKGLEWPVVILPRVRKGLFPVRDRRHQCSFTPPIAEKYGTSLEDEKRLWYVAVTRTRDRLFIFSGADGVHKPSELLDAKMKYEDVQCITKSAQMALKMKLSQILTRGQRQYSRMSVSDFLLLIECQYQFYLRKTCGVEVPVSDELGAGKILHSIIEKMSTVDSYGDIDQIVDDEVFLPLANQSREKRMKRAIKNKLKNAVANNMLKDIKRAEYKFSIQYEGVVIDGTVDAIREKEQGFEIIDWKSSVDAKFLNRYKLQLMIYALGLQNLGKHVLGASIVDLGAKKNHSEVKVNVQNDKIKEMERMVSSSLKRIDDGIPRTNPSLTSCSVCDVSAICPDQIVRRDKVE